MLTSTKRVIDPNAPVDPNAVQQGGDDLTASMGAGTDAAPASPQVTQPAAASKLSATQRTDTTPSTPVGGASVGGITQLPDGAGGAVTVPPIALAPPVSVANPQSVPIQGWGQSVGSTYDPSSGGITGDSSGSAGPRTAGAVAVAAANDAARAGQPLDERWGALAQRNAAIAAGQAVNADTGAVARPSIDRIDPATLPNNGLQTDVAAQNYSGAPLHPSDPAYMAAWNAARGTPDGIDPANPSGAIPYNAGLPPWLETGLTGSNPDGLLMGGIRSPASPSDTTPWLSSSGADGFAAPNAAAAAPPATTFDESQNLIGTQINPTLDPRTAKLQGMQDASLDKIANGPDRLALAKQYWDDFQKSTDPDYAHARTDALNDAAEHGYIGSGQLTNRYGDLLSSRQVQLDTAKSGFLNKALEGTIGDNQNLFADTSSAANTSYNQGANARNETRSERDYQRSLAEQAIQRRIAQAAAEQGMSQQEFENSLRLYGVGNANNPSGAYENAAALASSEAGGNATSMADLIKMLAARRAAPAGV